MKLLVNNVLRGIEAREFESPLSWDEQTKIVVLPSVSTSYSGKCGSAHVLALDEDDLKVRFIVAQSVKDVLSITSTKRIFVELESRTNTAGGRSAEYQVLCRQAVLPSVLAILLIDWLCLESKKVAHQEDVIRTLRSNLMPSNFK